MRLKDKIAFISGATSGIGRAAAELFGGEGARLILCARTAEKLEALKKELSDFDILTITLDVRDRQAVEKALGTLPPDWKEVDILLNNAGLARGKEKLQEGLIDDWEEMIDTNVKGLLYMTRLLVPGMKERGRGQIINIGSVAGRAAYPGGAVYCATKSAVKLISDGLRMDLVDTPVRVANIEPGMVETNFSVVRFHGDQAQANKVYEGIDPLVAQDIADTALFIATRPAHVQICEIFITPTNQASGMVYHKE